jgi:SUKH superfamily protein
MSMKDLVEALRLIEENENQADFAGPRDPALIDKAEKALGIKFPPSYRQFLLRLGAGNFGAFEIYGVIDDDWEDSSVPDGIWYTLNEREESDLPRHLLIIAAAGDGPLYCLKLGKEKEPPVIFYSPGLEEEEQESELAADNFGAFLLEGVRDELDA